MVALDQKPHLFDLWLACKKFMAFFGYIRKHQSRISSAKIWTSLRENMAAAAEQKHQA